jgi:hypothetical protein
MGECGRCLQPFEPPIADDRHVLSSIRQDGKYRHLAVVHLSQPTGPLTRNANRTLTLFDEAGFVDDEVVFAADVHRTQGVWQEEPQLAVPSRPPGKSPARDKEWPEGQSQGEIESVICGRASLHRRA